MKTLILLALLSSSASAQMFGGFNASFGKKTGAAAEIGYQFDTTGLALSLDLGSQFGVDEAPEYDRIKIAGGEIPRSTIREYEQSGALLASLNAGFYTAFGLGVFASIGVVRSDLLVLTRVYDVPSSTEYFLYREERKVLFGSVGGDVRYRNALGYFRAGYATRRGVTAGFGLMF